MLSTSAPVALPVAPSTSISRIPSLDGVRAVAILTVFAAHAGLKDYIPGGFGVTVFFFLSGYLITTLLRHEFEVSGRINIGAFYVRRAVRILPPMYAVLALAILLALLGATNGDVKLGAVAALLVNVSNYHQTFAGADAGLPPGTGVYWSLGVEEHFYLLFPFLCLGLMRLTSSQRRRAAVIVTAALVVLAWRVILVQSGASEDRTYLASDTRVDSLLWGAALALWSNPALDRPHSFGWLRELAILAVAGVALLLMFVTRNAALRETVRYTIQGIALVPVFYFAILRSEWPLFRWLEWRPIRYIGAISYTMYLVHAVILAVAVAHFDHVHPIVRGTASLALTIGVAHISYVVMERPLGDLRRRLHSSRAIAGASASARSELAPLRSAADGG